MDQNLAKINMIKSANEWKTRLDFRWSSVLTQLSPLCTPLNTATLLY